MPVEADYGQTNGIKRNATTVAIRIFLIFPDFIFMPVEADYGQTNGIKRNATSLSALGQYRTV
jgi:hypothetical protein